MSGNPRPSCSLAHGSWGFLSTSVLAELLWAGALHTQSVFSRVCSRAAATQIFGGWGLHLDYLWGVFVGFCWVGLVLVCEGFVCFLLFVFNTRIKLLKLEPQWHIWCFRYFNKKNLPSLLTWFLHFRPAQSSVCCLAYAVHFPWALVVLEALCYSFMTLTDLTHLFCFISEHCKRNGATPLPRKADNSDNMKGICSVSLCTGFLSWRAPLSYRQAGISSIFLFLLAVNYYPGGVAQGNASLRSYSSFCSCNWFTERIPSWAPFKAVLLSRALQ